VRELKVVEKEVNWYDDERNAIDIPTVIRAGIYSVWGTCSNSPRHPC